LVLEDLLVVQDNLIVPHIRVGDRVETERIHFMPVQQEIVLEHLEEELVEQNPTLDHPIYLFLDHLEVEVDRVVEVEGEDRNLPQVEV
jgi:hypothetical protein